MSQVCEITGRGPQFGHKVSHSNIKSKTRWNLNFKQKRYLVPELGTWVKLRLTTSAVRTVDKFGGLSNALVGLPESQLSDRMQRLRRKLVAARQKGGAPKSSEKRPSLSAAKVEDKPQDQAPQDKA